MTPSGIDPATFRFVAQSLNHCATACPNRNEVRKADNLPPSNADVTESASLNLPELSGPHRPVMGILYLYFY
jgi:hypothetical protein